MENGRAGVPIDPGMHVIRCTYIYVAHSARHMAQAASNMAQAVGNIAQATGASISCLT